MEELIRSVTPVRLELVWGTVTGVAGTTATFLFGEWSNALQALAMFMLIDYITGVLAAYMRPRSKLSSKRGLKGIAKKLTLISLLVAAHFLDLAIGQNVFCLLLIEFCYIVKRSDLLFSAIYKFRVSSGVLEFLFDSRFVFFQIFS